MPGIENNYIALFSVKLQMCRSEIFKVAQITELPESHSEKCKQFKTVFG